MDSASDRIVDGLFKLIEKETVSDDQLISNLHCISALVSLIKIPDVRNLRLTFQFPNRIYNQATTVCAIVPDKGPIPNRDYKATTGQYEKALRKTGYQFTVITYHQLKSEFRSYEARRKLACSFDLFIVDRSIQRNMASVTGKEFRQRRKWPLAMPLKRLVTRKCDESVELLLNHLKKDCAILTGAGSSFSVRLCSYEDGVDICKQQIASLVKQLDSTVPGGRANIRSIHLNCNGFPRLPIYLSSTTDQAINIEIPCTHVPVAPLDVSDEDITTLDDNLAVRFTSLDNFVIVDKLTGKEVDPTRRKPKRKWCDAKLVQRVKSMQERTH